MYRIIAAGLVASALAIGVIANVSAAQEELEVDCGADGTFTVLLNGNGEFTPGRIVGGGVAIPVALSNQHGTFTDNEGNVFTEDPPDVAKGNGNPGKNKDLLTCDFEVSFEDENGSGTFSGTATVFIVGR